jgi:hypothetical protein
MHVFAHVINAAIAGYVTVSKYCLKRIYSYFGIQSSARWLGNEEKSSQHSTAKT